MYIAYIKDGISYLGDIYFSISPMAYIREAYHYNDLTSLCPNTYPLSDHGNWYVEWGVERLAESVTLADVLFDECEPPKYLSETAEIHCNNLDGYAVIYGDERYQNLKAVFPHEHGRYFIHIVANIEGSPGLEAIREICQHNIVQTIFSTIGKNRK